MKKIIFFAIVLIGLSEFPDRLFADMYILAMSKNDQLCQYLGQLFNTDLWDKGKVVLEDHKEFNWVKWDKEFFLIFPHGSQTPNFSDKLKAKYGNTEEYQTYTKILKYAAVFDINNDGQKEIVFLRHTGLNGFAPEENAIDRMEYVSGEKMNQINGMDSRKFYDSKSGMIIQRIGESYQLFEYPVQKKYSSPGLGIKSAILTISRFYIRPLNIDRNHYLALFGNVGTDSSSGDNITDKDSIVIIKVNKENKCEDNCYFVKVIDNGKEDE